MSTTKTHTVLIALGTNLGNKEANLLQALNHIKATIGPIEQQSRFYQTAPVGAADQEFLNSTCIASTKLEPSECLSQLLKIEATMGRVREIHWGNRLIDLDILLWLDQEGESVTTNSEHLTVPHPHMHLRSFVLDPAKEIAGDWVHPQQEKTITQLHQILHQT